jgi:hypothetical protein
VSAFAAHPGFVRSDFGNSDDLQGLARLGMLLSQAFMQSAARGAGASIHAATAPGLEVRSGVYIARGVLGNFGPPRETPTSPAARDEAAAARLWRVSEELVAGSGGA